MNPATILLCVLALILLVVTLDLLFSSPRPHRNISDEEFLAAIPDADPEIALKVRAIVSDQLDIPTDDIHPDDRFVEDLKAD